MVIKTKFCPDCGAPIHKVSKYCRKCCLKGSRNPFYGKKHSPELMKKIIAKTTKKNPTYTAIHLWIQSRKGKAKKCVKCGKTSTDCRIEWANKDHKYSRIISDYFSLCCKCHYAYDKLNGLNKYTAKQDKKTGKFISF